MVTVLVTRPAAASEKLTHELKRYGFDSVIEPMLSMEMLGAAPPAMEDVRATAITSANTLDALESGEYEIDGLIDLPCFCIGPRTGERAKNFGFRDVRSAPGGGIELARLIDDVLMNKDNPILHIAAQDADSKTRDGLEQMGYKVIAWPVYAAVPASKLTERTVQKLKQQKLDAVLVFSVRTAEVLKGLLSQNALEACCESLSAIGLSETVTDALRTLPWRKLVAATVPTEDAVIECLKQLHPVS